MKTKKMTTVCLMALTAIISIACGSVKEDVGDVKGKSLKVGVLRTVDSLPIYVGDNKDYFEKNGANVELVEFGSASDQSKAIESGEIDGMMTDMVVQSLLQKGGTEMRTVTTALGADISAGKFLVVSSPNSGILTPEDAVGRTLGISEGTMMEYLVDSYFSELGLDINEVQKTNIPSLSLRFETLMEDGVDMAILPDPMGDLAVSQGCHVIVDDTKLQNNYSCTVVAFRKDSIDSKNDAIKAFLKGYDMAISDINEGSESDKDFIYSVSNVPEALRDTWNIPVYIQDVVPSEPEVSRVMKWMQDKGLLDKQYDYSEIVDKIN